MFQRSRANRNLAGRRLLAAIDPGASKVACVIAAVSAAGENAEILGAGQYGVPWRDMRRDPVGALEAGVRASLDAAERMAGEGVREVVVAAPGRHLLTRRIGVDLELLGGPATLEDITDCLVKGGAIAAPEGATAMHALPVSFSIDGEDAGPNPCGLVGGRLTVDMLGVAVAQSRRANLETLLERCNLGLAQLVAAPLAAAEAVLIDDERELGCVVVDIGARSTDFAVFENGVALACGGVRLGGDHITRDIAKIFGGSIAGAERVKALHGAAAPGGADDHRFIEIPQGADGDVARVSRAELLAVIEPRFEELLVLARDAWRRAVSPRMAGGLRRAVITGGGSLLTGARETAEKIFEARTRLGRAALLDGAPDAATAPQFAAAMGAIGLAAKCEPPWRRVALAPGVRFGSVDRAPIAAPGRGVADWLRANF